jgi:hypothetical protein
MRLRFAMLAPALAAFAALAAPSLAGAAQSSRLTINTLPNTIIAGKPVLIYGRLTGTHAAGQPVDLYRKLSTSNTWQLAGVGATNSEGYYEFVRDAHVVFTNRSWYAVAPKVGVQSPPVHEWVSSTMTFAESTSNATTGQAVTFIGHVSPSGYHVGEQVLLQSEVGASGDQWLTVKTGVLNASSDFNISVRFRVPGARDMRVLLPGDIANIAGVTDPLTMTVQQTENPAFTINTSAPVLVDGQSATISGSLYTPGMTPAPEELNVPVTLWARQIGANRFQPVDQGTTGSTGTYSFDVTPQHSTVYRVSTTFSPPALRRTAVLLEAVRDAVSLTPSTLDAQVGVPVTLTGTVAPDAAGHLVQLEQLGTDGSFHVISVAFISPTSAYQFKWTPGYPGTYVVRSTVPGDRRNASGSSTPVNISVALPPVAALPTSS